MKRYLYLSIIFTVLLSCKTKEKNNQPDFDLKKYPSKNNYIKMSEVNVKTLIDILKTKNHDKLNILTTIGQTKTNWLNQNDLEYLISKINSKEKSKCIVRDISSFIPKSTHMTIGNHVISIIESYRKKEPYPNHLYICKTYDKEKIDEILEWWKTKNVS
ncbi:hypothetical protein [Tenacibaculum geojense]|uniref:Lipoprotein n=1 Tax=Tenacibaculum geojense TaxID=915352 RepID=A0ABW3JSJ0_9FLAO